MEKGDVIATVFHCTNTDVATSGSATESYGVVFSHLQIVVQ